MRWIPKRSRLTPGLLVAVAACGVVVVSVTGSDRTEPADHSRASASDVQLQVDEAYLDLGGPTAPGEIVGAPVADAESLSEVGPRYQPGLASVLVYMDPALRSDSIQRADLRAFAAERRARVKYEYDTVMPDVINLRDVPESEIEALENLPGVLRVERDEYHPNVLMLHDSVPLIRGLQSQIAAAGLSADGAGVRICIVDTGIDSDHMMYADRIDTAAGYDFYNDDSNPEDDHGHGSHCSGIAAGRTGLSWDPCGTGAMPFQGVAPEATLIGVKVLNSSGGGYDSDIIAGINYCADQTPSGARADVISMSIGTGSYSGPCTHSWAVAANNAVANGVVAVAASGNENNSNSMGSPACGVDVIAVGMTWKNDYPTCEDPTTNWSWGICTDYAPQTDQVGCFSNESDYLDVTAPGANIWSASIAAGGGSITGMSGTSMSCPTVAGLGALILGVDPTLTPAEVRQVIRDGAIDMGPAGFDRAYGYGRIDVINSLNLLTPCTGDPDCDDGLFCNGAETCVAQSCQAGSDPCPGQSCDEVADQCVAAPTVQYEWTMNTNPGWSVQGLWAWGQPTGGGGQYGGPDPTSGYTGINVYGYNLSGDYENSLPERHLTTTAIDCTDLVEVSVAFQRWLGVEVSTYDHAYFRVSNNGSTWTTVWQNSAQVADTAWTLQEFDISAIADNQPTVYLRWTMGTTDGSWQFCGWNIDDVQIIARDTGAGCSVPADCDDGLWCTGAEDCVSGSCVAGTPPDCSDGVVCTDDSRNEGTDSCDHVANNGYCADGLFCNGAETCHVTLGCQAGTAVNCNDGVACTDDSCNEGTDSCNNVPNGAYCDNGLFCDGAETCHPTLGCQAGSDPCVGLFGCDEVNDVCVECFDDGDCDDGLFCNGVETCDVLGVCQDGTAVDCSDGVGCTDDSCNESTDSCNHVANNSLCDDGLFCNGTETCHVTLDCQAGTDPCAPDPCDEINDRCVGAGAEAWMVFTAAVSVPGVGTVQNEDIVAYDTGAGTWSLVFDGSDVGLGGFAVNGMAVLPDGDILLTFTAAGTVGGVAMDDSDIVRFTPTALGATTAGSFSLYFDGSDVGLTVNDEDLDAIGLLSDGRLVVSVIGNFSGTGASGVDEDLFVFNATSLGATTAGSFAMYFDGSDVGLSTSSNEDVDAAGFTTSGTILLSTLGSFSVTGVSGADEDLFEFAPTSLGSTTSGTFSMFLDLSTLGISTAADVIAVELIE
ncbi:MAG: S8 family serine peptidase [Planctomycetota bacterium]